MSRIVKLDVENVMRVNAVHIEPDGNIVILGGDNAQGKTSVLDAISMAIGGTRLCPKVPIKDGQDEAEISVELGDLSITRKFKRDGEGFRSSLTVKNAAGEPVAKPQETLNALIGKLAFDPLEFARMPPARARETLRDLVGLDVEQLEEKLGNVYRKRTEAWREKRDAQAVVDELVPPGEVPRKTPTDPITKAIADASKLQVEYEKQRAVCERHRAEEIRLHAAIAETEANLQRLNAALVREEQLTEEANGALDASSLPNIEAIQADLDSAIRINEHCDEMQRAKDRYQAKVDQAEEKAAAWKELDAEHNQIDHEIKKRTEAVEYPIPELECRREGVYYQGVPFEQGSRAERIKVSLAMGMAMNKDLRVLLIRDGSVLDKNSMATIKELADEHDFQFWIEMARGYENAEGAIVIDDGGVV
jgi:DNA repair exonuclease SbcCD ATPase subunit